MYPLLFCVVCSRDSAAYFVRDFCSREVSMSIVGLLVGLGGFSDFYAFTGCFFTDLMVIIFSMLLYFFLFNGRRGV